MRRADKKAETRARLLDAAEALIAEGGWAAARVAAVTAYVDIAAGSFYTHFESKDALLIEVVRRVAARELKAAERAAAVGGKPEDRVARAAETFCRRALAAPTFARALLFEAVEPAVDAERRAIRRIYRDGFAAILLDGASAARGPAHDPQLVAAALVGALAEALVGPLSAPMAVADHDDVVETLVQLCRLASSLAIAGGP